MEQNTDEANLSYRSIQIQYETSVMKLVGFAFAINVQ